MLLEFIKYLFCKDKEIETIKKGRINLESLVTRKLIGKIEHCYCQSCLQQTEHKYDNQLHLICSICGSQKQRKSIDSNSKDNLLKESVESISGKYKECCDRDRIDDYSTAEGAYKSFEIECYCSKCEDITMHYAENDTYAVCAKCSNVKELV